MSHLAAGIHEHCTDDGFERIGQNRCFFGTTTVLFTAAQPNEPTDTQAPRGNCQGLGVHHAFAQIGEQTFVEFWVTSKHFFGQHQTNYGIAEKLESLVGWLVSVFG